MDNKGLDIDEGSYPNSKPQIKETSLNGGSAPTNGVNGTTGMMSSTLILTDNDANGKGAPYDDGTYNPFDHRDKTNATPNYGALIHILKSSLGSGVLAMPMAFLHGGLIFGIIGTVIVGLICTHCVQLLVKCSQLLCAKLRIPSLGFPETAEEAFRSGPKPLRKYSAWAREFVNITLFATYYLGNTVYVVFIAKTLQQVVNHNTSLDMDIRLYVLMVAIPLIPLGSIRSLRYLVPFTATATVFIIVGLGMTLYYIFDNLGPIQKAEYVAPVHSWPLFFSTVLFAMEGIGTVLPVENSMKNPENFLGCPGVLNVSMTVVVLFYGALGFFGYWSYEDKTQGSVTLNLPCNAVAETVKLLVAASILLTYGLQFTVPTSIIWKVLEKRINEKRHTSAYYIMRVIMILGTILIAVIVPQLSPIISFVGAVCLSLLGLFTPAIIEIIFYYDIGYGRFKWRLIKDIIIVILSLAALFFGAYASLLDIIHPSAEPDTCQPGQTQ